MNTPNKSRYVDRVPWVHNALICASTDRVLSEFDPVFIVPVFYAAELIIRAMTRADQTMRRPR